VIRNLLDFIYSSTPAEFKSAFGMSESVTRLRTATRRYAFGVRAEQSAAGPVGESRVRLQRVIPMVGNSFKPFFFGRFEARSDGVYLTGRFTMLGFVKTFMTIWLGGVLVLGTAFAFTVVNQRSGGWVPALGALGMFPAGIALVGLGKWFSRNDVAWLSNVIGNALGGPVVIQAPELLPRTTPRPHSESPLPTFLRIAALILFLIGVMQLWSATSGISSWHTSPGHAVVTRFSSWPLRLAIGAYGFFTLGLAYGVYRRKQWAWRLGLVFFGAAGLTSILQAFTSSQFPDVAVLRAISCVLMLAVTLYWTWWWYGQRIHFSSDTNPLPKSSTGGE
jgi:hypothetical protein